MNRYDMTLDGTEKLKDDICGVISKQPQGAVSAAVH